MTQAVDRERDTKEKFDSERSVSVKGHLVLVTGFTETSEEIYLL